MMKVRDVGKFIREQRHSAQMSLRKLASLAGVSNPYLSQIERGLRRPSAEILNAIAKALRISAETLYVKAGILDDRKGREDLVSIILADRSITERQKQVLIQIYESFREETRRRRRRRRKATKSPAALKTSAETVPVDAAEAADPTARAPGERPGGRVESAG
ncbi:MAG: helix-turn-helix domain-containing protein [Actinomycetota bacterium]